MKKVFSLLILFVLVVMVCPLFAALDSAQTVNGIELAGKLATVISNITGHSQIGTIITLALAAIVPIVSFIFGHAHGKSAGK
jgi:hypothetical protein